ncbi:uncharacterized protein HaLaN_21792 [Haematococcus lacustris]|uniref:AMP-binding enzyme C-terminal domain-containing protein n=1 Tax=Haematococcus lacustris TaxID=44745 RepID=A0A699ZWU5_HAELA|nr:uncharacterized protein HaLaN_21792 [Haematococcus lacustris]
MTITDRSKDVIKSGGEWISSIEIENLAMSHSAVAEAAVVAIPSARWGERPLLVVALKPAFAALDDLQLDLADLVTTVDIVAYHILEGEWKSQDLPDNEAIVLGNQTYYKALSSIDGQMYVTDQIGNQGSVVLADIEIANGCVVHLLNTECGEELVGT